MKSSNMISYLKAWLHEAIDTAGYEVKRQDILVEINEQKPQFGNYSSPIALQIGRQIKQNSHVIANKIIANLRKNDFISKVVIVLPGFINIDVHFSAFAKMMNKIIKQKQDYGRLSNNNIKYNVEYVSANPTGLLHLGHARNAAIGETIANVLSFRGYDVTREYYINDAGNQINILAFSLYVRYQNLLGNKIELTNDCYHGQEISVAATNLFEQVAYKYDATPFSEVKSEFSCFAINYMMSQIKIDLKKYRIKINSWFSEATIYQDQKIIKVLDLLTANNAIYEDDKAVWLKTKQFGDDKNRVLVKSDKSYTYLLPDLVYHHDKYQRSDFLINIWGADHIGYLPRLQAGLNLINNDSKKLAVVFAQMVRLVKNGKEQKMSKRSGTAVTLREMIAKVGSDVMRYFMISRTPDSHLDIDIDVLTSTDKNKNPVFYLQYASARIHQLLNQVGSFPLVTVLQYLNHEKEKQLLLFLDEYQLVLDRIIEKLQPHLMVNYLQKLAKTFHSYYNECKIINDSNKGLMYERLNLVVAVQVIINNGLELIGVSAPKKM